MNIFTYMKDSAYRITIYDIEPVGQVCLSACKNVFSVESIDIYWHSILTSETHVIHMQ